MVNILFVCHGNICRSPMAEFCMKDLVRKAGLEDSFRIESAATSTEEIRNGVGNPVYPPARRELARHGLSCSGKQAVLLRKEDYLRYDHIIGMDHNNLRNLRRILGDDPEGKVRLLLDYTDKPGDIADPWYTGNFEQTWDDILRGCRGLLQDIGSGNSFKSFAEASVDMENHCITLCRTDDVSAFLPQIDGADADFLAELLEDKEDVFAVCLDEKPVGLSVIAREVDSGFLYIFIFPAYRERGFGTASARLAEQQLLSSGLRNMETAYPEGNAAAACLAVKCGFSPKYSSARMKYRGKCFDVPPLPIRPYEDKDYPAAFALSAEAFHKMRTETGRFPESVPETPSDKGREHWRNTADERFVYVLNNEIVGYAHVDGSELDSVSIKTSHQGKGLGRRFVRFLVNFILENKSGIPYLWCVVGNDKARQLYDSLGFEEAYREVFAFKKLPDEG